MDKYLTLRKKLKNREKVTGASMCLFHDTSILERINERFDVDFILFDTEHGVFDTTNLIPSLSTMRLLGIPSIVRVEDANYNLVAKVVDMGADGIMIPRTESLEQIQTAMDGLYFPPIGKKGLGGHGQMRKGETFNEFHKTRFLYPQIESLKGVELLPKILEKYHKYIGAVVVGPYDLSATMGIPFQFQNPDHISAIKKVFDIAKEYGVSAGIFCDDEIKAKFYHDLGANFLWLGLDREYLLRGLKDMLDGTKDL